MYECPLALNLSRSIRYYRAGSGNNVMGPIDFAARRSNLVESLCSSGYVVTDRVRKAFLQVPRELFVPASLASSAYVDTPLPIGEGQTISAPSMIAIMLEELDLRKGLKVFEVGAGSGYNAALLYETVERKVITVERLRRLVELARRNLKASGYEGRVDVVEGDGTKGYEPESPYDRILVTAGAPAIPRPLVEELATNGILGIPVGSHQSFQEFVTGVKGPDGSFKTKSHGGCAFVPLIGEHGWRDWHG